MPNDPTEAIRREMQADINSKPKERVELEAVHGQVWDTTELQTEFKVMSFLAPFCMVERKSDGVRGSVMFQGSPRYYYGFVQE